jgi:tRNA uridine 5-carboxymethylaminomethyl modification enzyme
LIETDIKYAGYIARQYVAVERLRLIESKKIPPQLDYSNLRGLRAETRQKLAQFRPETLGQAARISGITPSDLMLLSTVIEAPRSIR